ncbi:hypothetical protein ACFXA2_07375 [Micromonospora chalcea]
MGLMDHNRTWLFELRAAPGDCIAAFRDAMKGKSGFSLRKAEWHLTPARSEHGLPAMVATYEGRGGAASLATALYGRRAAETEAAAKGSQITFEVKGFDPEAGLTACAMWLSLAGKQMVVFTPDAGFYRSYMNDVARKLAELDPEISATKA